MAIVKSSHQTLMLAILLGLLAWVLDAVISWHFFPGKSYLEMLWGHDPERTLYVRSSVVLLFFLFGLWVGHTLRRLERHQERDRKNIRLLEGVRDIQSCTFAATEVEEMLDRLTGLIRSTFGFEEVYLVRIHPETRAVLSRHSTLGAKAPPRKFRSLEKQIEIESKPFDPGGSTRPDDRNRSVQAPLSFGQQLFGGVMGTGITALPKKSPWYDQFVSVCRHVGQAIGHFYNQEKSESTSARLYRLYEFSPVGVFVTTGSGRALYLNPALQRILTGSDRSDEDLTSRPVVEWYENPERRKDFLHLLHRDGMVSDFEFRLRRADGKLRTVIMAARLNRKRDSEDTEIEGFMLDITHRRNAEESNLLLQHELQKSRHFKAITVLAGGVAHEFNNILQAMTGSAFLAGMRLAPGQDEVKKYLADIQESGKRAAKLCDQMLSYAGKRAMVLRLEVVDEVIRRLLGVLRKETSSVEISTQFGAPDIRAHVDEPSLSEVVNNLVVNAMESVGDRNPHEEKGWIAIRTSTRSVEELESGKWRFTRQLSEELYWILSIRDNGKGIAEETLPHIFEPFYTTKFQGRGLGLSAVAGIVEKFDGTLGVRNLPEHGAEFLVCLPVAESVVLVDDDDSEAEAEAEAETAGEEVRRVWVVDDEPLIGETVTRMLDQNGFSVKSFSDPTRFLDAFTDEEAARTSCLVLDVTMPKLSGIEVLKTVRERSPNLPVLMMSGFDESEQSPTFEELGISGFIHKPFRMEELRRKLNSVLHEATRA